MDIYQLRSVSQSVWSICQFDHQPASLSVSE